MRTFIAIELSDAVRETLTQTVCAMQAARPPVKLRWVAVENQHLTLRFLGELNPTVAKVVGQSLEQAASGIAPFDITLADAGCFPNIYKPNVLWIGVQEPSGTLQRLHEAIGSQLARINFTPEARPFTPHLTLARVPREANARERKALGEWLAQQPPPTATPMRVTQVHLMQSELLPGGPRYTALRVVELGSGNGKA